MSKTTNKFSPEVRERAVRMVLDGAGEHGSCWQAITSNDWVKKAEVDSGKGAGIPSEMAEKSEALIRHWSWENGERAGAGEPKGPAGQRQPSQGQVHFPPLMVWMAPLAAS